MTSGTPAAVQCLPMIMPELWPEAALRTLILVLINPFVCITLVFCTLAYIIVNYQLWSEYYTPKGDCNIGLVLYILLNFLHLPIFR